MPHTNFNHLLTLNRDLYRIANFYWGIYHLHTNPLTYNFDEATELYTTLVVTKR